METIDVTAYTGVRYKAHQSFWKGQLDQVVDRFSMIQNNVPTKKGAYLQTISFPIEQPVSQKIEQMVQGHDTGIFVVILSALGILLQRYTGKRTIVVDTPMFHLPSDLARDGIMEQYLPMVLAVEVSKSWKNFLLHTQQVVTESYRLQNYPLHFAAQEKGYSDGKVRHTNVLMRYEGIHAGKSLPEYSGYDFILSVGRNHNRFEINVKYDVQGFEDFFIANFQAHLLNLLKGVENKLDTPLCEIDFFTEAEKQCYFQEFREPFEEEGQTLQALFEKQVAQNPQAIAVDFNGQSLTYQALNEKVNQLAHYLREECEITAGDRVGLLLERSPLMVIGLLGILKAGAVYLPVEMNYPEERKRFILADAQARVLITHADAIFQMDYFKGNIVALDIQLDSFTSSKKNPAPITSGDDTAYVLYTSGSTGQPKGVLVKHESFVNTILDQQSCFKLAAGDKMIQLAAASFDVSLFEVFLPLLSGATVVCVPKNVIEDVNQFVQYLADHRVTIMGLTPSYLSLLDLEKLTTVRTVFMGGESPHASQVQTLLRMGKKVFNQYGLTETSCISLYHECKLEDLDQTEQIPIGKPLRNTQVFILDEQSALVPQGFSGEICIAGKGVAEGYLNCPALTKERFVAHPFKKNHCLFRTGDRGILYPNGEIVFLGRMDEQVKIRGMRVEPGEVSSFLKKVSGVQDAYTLVEGEDSDKALTAVIVPDLGEAFTLHQLLKQQETNPDLNDSIFYLPNEIVINHINKAETEAIYQEIFEDQIYFQHGIYLKEHAVVLDVGANIGLFSLFTGLCHPGVKIFAFEPIEPVFEVLKANAALYPIDITSLNVGLSDKKQEVNFRYYPQNTALSGRDTGQRGDAELVRKTIANQYELEDVTLSEGHLEKLVEEKTHYQTVRCQLITLSEIIHEYQLSHIDLLKIDVERSELEVLKGIDQNDWPGILQLVIEVHDVDGRLKQITELLEEKGYHIAVTQEEVLKGTGLFNVYASRMALIPEKRQKLKDSVVCNQKGRWTQPAAFLQHIREKCRQQLPDYMVPVAFKLVPRIPLNPHGKVDKKALARLSWPEAEKKQPYEAPQTVLEKKLAGMWEEILGKTRIGINDNFFELGGHSLRATKMASRIYKELGVQVDIGDIFSFPTLAALSEVISHAEQVGFEDIPVLAAQPYYEVSHAQKRLWILHQFEESKSAYNAPEAYLFHGLDPHAFERACEVLVSRHESLRTTFITVNNEPKQVIHSPDTFGFKVSYHDFRDREQQDREIEKFTWEETHRAFDLEKGPLVSAHLLRLDNDRHLFLFIMHHIIGDGWSMMLLMKELMVLYNAFLEGKKNPLTPLKVQYKEYAAWQNSLLGGEKLEKYRNYWLDQFRGEIPVLNLPTTYPRPAVKTYRGEIFHFVINPTLTNHLKNVSKAKGKSLFMTLLASVYALLYRYTGQEDMVIGSPIAGREHRDLESMVGLFLNNLALRLPCKADDSFDTLLDKVEKITLDAYEHQAYPFDKLIEELDMPRDTSRSPLYDVVVVLQNFDQQEEKETLKDVVSEVFDTPYRANMVDLRIVFEETQNAIVATFNYNTDLFSESFIRKMALHFVRLLQNLLQESEKAIATLNYIPEEEQALLLQSFNDTVRVFPAPKTLAEIFEQQAANTPGALALIGTNREYTYQELNQEANRLAHYLRDEWGLKTNDVVGLMVDRSDRMIIAILGILKSGAAYLPIDPAYPRERKTYMLAHGAVKALLTDADLMFDIQDFHKPIFGLDIQLSTLSTSMQNPAVEHTAKDLAYVIFTSGSTGKPKGVMVTQGGVVNMALDQVGTFGVTEKDRVLQFASLSFDASVSEIWMAFCAGAALVLADQKTLRDPGLMVPFMKAKAVSVVTLPPSYLNVLDLNNLTFLKTIITAGEAANPKAVVHCATFCDCFNAYGPTEASVCTSIYKVLPTDSLESGVPLGKPIANTQVYVLDKNQQLVPVGVEGEICISGAGLAKGYLDQPALTAEKFVPHPFMSGEKLYRTGDRGKWQPNGNLMYLGRNDTQIKLRGYRIEADEIKNVLLQHEAVQDALIVSRKDTHGDGPLVAYVVSTEITHQDVSTLRQYLQQYLPAFMIPAHFIVLASLPLNTHGKVDIAALPLPESLPSVAGDGFIAPRNEAEAQITMIWEEVLGKSPISVLDNFFDVGGHSLKATQIVSRISEQLSVKMELGDIFAAPTIEQLAAWVQGQPRKVQEAIPVAAPKACYEASHAQRRLWFMDRIEEKKMAYNMPGAYDIYHQNFNVQAFTKAIYSLVERHESLRTTFIEIKGEPQQKIHDFDGFNFRLDYVDVRLEHHPEEKVRLLAFEEAVREFDLEAGPLLRAKLLQLDESRYTFLFTVHHIIADGWSMEVLLKEVLSLYAAYSEGKENPLPALSIQYKDYAEWQRRQLQEGNMREHRDYWLERLKGDLPVLALPTDFERPAVRTNRGDKVDFKLDERLATGIRRLAKKYDTSLFVVLTSLVKTLLYRYSGQSDMVVGTPALGRNHKDLENQIGLFLNNLPLRTSFSGEDSFEELIRKVRKVVTEAFDHQLYPYDLLVEDLGWKRELSRFPLFDVLIGLRPKDVYGRDVEGLSSHQATVKDAFPVVSNMDLRFEFIESNDILITGKIIYNTDLFKKETIRQFITYLTQITAEVTTNEDTRLFDISLDEGTHIVNNVSDELSTEFNFDN